MSAREKCGGPDALKDGTCYACTYGDRGDLIDAQAEAARLKERVSNQREQIRTLLRRCLDRRVEQHAEQAGVWRAKERARKSQAEVARLRGLLERARPGLKNVLCGCNNPGCFGYQMRILLCDIDATLARAKGET